MALITIEKDIPIPPDVRPGEAGPLTTAIRSLGVGDSFVIEGEIDRIRKRAGKETGKSFVCREVEAGVRVWRTK